MAKNSGAHDVMMDMARQEGIESPRQVATYIADVSLELRNIARGAGFEFLSYLLEMTFQEAFDLSQQLEAKTAGSGGQG